MRFAIYPSTGTDATDYGKIVVVSSYGHVALARYNSDGTVDNTFGTNGEVVTPFPNGSSMAWATTVQPDGKIVVAGCTATPGTWNPSLLRYNADGSLDTTFSNSYGQQIFPNGGLVMIPSGTPDNRFFAVAIQPNGDIVAVGKEIIAGSSTGYDFLTARYLASEPEIGSFTVNPSSVTSGSSVSLTASNITDGNPGSTIKQVIFYYYDSSGTQQVLGSGSSDGLGDWTITFTVNLAPGTYTLFSLAEDGYGVFGDPKALTLTVQ